MEFLTSINSRLSRWSMYIACLSIIGLVVVVDYGVVLRYVFNHAPPFVEQVALLLVITVSMFGAAAGIRDSGHIGLDSLVTKMPLKVQYWCHLIVSVLIIVFAIFLVICGSQMVEETYDHIIPTLGISEALRFVPPIIAGVFMILFSIEHIIAVITDKKVVSSWH